MSMLEDVDVHEYAVEPIQVDVLDIGKRKRRLARLMRGVLPIPLTPDVLTQCDALAARRAIEGMERERRDRRGNHVERL